MSPEAQYITRCLSLAANGLGFTRPNPLVGCVIVKEDKILSEGYHQQYGTNHAERNAILRLWEKDRNALKGATLYVNLEPCSHHGLTPPCADLIIEAGIGKVVCSNDDPNPLVAGRGFEKLLQAGITVERHVLEKEGRFLNRRFFTFMKKKRPYIILKWAQTANGLMASDQRPYWISNPLTTCMSHKWRTQEAAILVGAGTVRADNPTLTARHYSGPNPTRIVLGGKNLDHQAYNIFNDQAPTLHYSEKTELKSLLSDLYQKKIQSMIVEGGRNILDQFLTEGLWDEIRIVTSPKTFPTGLPAPLAPVTPTTIETYASDQILYHYNPGR